LAQFITSAVSADNSPNGPKEFISVLRNNFSELSGFTLLTPSGMRVRIDILGWCPFDYLPQVA